MFAAFPSHIYFYSQIKAPANNDNNKKKMFEYKHTRPFIHVAERDGCFAL